jgi:EAL domain-containing protein (putative c-di-GMP-specific phosphodiesterase class I)
VASNTPPKSKVLLVDDDAQIRSTFSRILQSAGFDIKMAETGTAALASLADGEPIDVIVTDLIMPGMDGIAFLRAVRLLDLEVPVLVVTGSPTVESAVATVQHGGYRYLMKPVSADELTAAVTSAAAMHRLAVLKRRALEFCDTSGSQLEDRASLEAHFERTMAQLWIAFQPIVRWRKGIVYGYEGLMRSSDATLGNPALILNAAERLGRVHELGRRIRRVIAGNIDRAPPGAVIFVNLHAVDLNDEDLYAPNAPLSAHADRVVLEITERSSLEQVNDVRSRIASLRKVGYRIAVDDLGAGYAGLSSFGQLEPDIVKLDMTLIRDIDTSTRKSSIVRSMISVCMKDLETLVVCEGVETEAERDTLDSLGADLLQGYLFGRPHRDFL